MAAPYPVDRGKFFGDVGFAGPDGGKGGKFLLLPPDYKEAVPDGYYVYRSATKNVFIFLRGFYEGVPARIFWSVTLYDAENSAWALNRQQQRKQLATDCAGQRSTTSPVFPDSGYTGRDPNVMGSPHMIAR